MSNIKDGFKEKKVKQFKCSNCGGELTVMAKRTNFVGCNYCGAVIETSSDAYRVINQLQAPGDFPPKSFLKLGMIGKISGKHHMIIGRTRWESDYMEYWVEDGESGYDNETWEYDEWVLISEDAQYFYIIEDADGYHFSKSYTPKYPNLPNGSKVVDFNSNKSRFLNEYGTSKVAYFEGESTYQIKPGDTVSFGAYELGQETYVVESRLLENGELKEIEFFLEYEKSYAELVRAFADDDTVKSRQEEIKARVEELDQIKRRRKMISKICMFIFFACTFIFIISFFFYGKDVIEQTFPCEAGCGIFDMKSKRVDDSVKAQLYPDSSRINYVFQTREPIKFDAKDHILDVYLRASIAGETDFFANMEILDEKGDVVQEIPCNFHRYIEEGSEDDYVDSKESEGQSFQIDKSAAYHFRVVMELPATKVNDIQAKLTMTIGSILNRYFLMLMILSFIVWIIAFIVYKRTK